MSENLETIIPEIEAMSTEVPADLELDEELKTLTKTVEVTTEIATEPVVEKEPEKQTEKEVPEKVPDKQEALETVLQVLKKYNLKDTLEQLKKEAKVSEDGTPRSESEVNNDLSTYKSEGNPDYYEEAYIDIKKFVDGSLDAYKYELGMILYPVFVHMYLELVYNGHEQQAIRLMNKFGKEQEIYYQGDLMKLSQVTKREHMKGNEITDTFKSNEFIIRMSRDTLATLKRHLQEKKQSIVLNIIQEHLYFDMYEGMSRNKQQIDSVAGAMIGESTRADNKAKVYYGMPKEPDYQFTAVDDDEEAEAGEGDKPKKKKAKKEPLFGKKTKSDPNAPPVDRLPLPELKDNDKMEKVKALREASKRITLGPETLPSICCYTLLNSAEKVLCAEISEDSSILAVGFANSNVKLWSLLPQKLKGMKSAEQLADIDHDAEDVWARIIDERNVETTRLLCGHSGPIYRISFSPDRTLLLSCSEDTTVRLWSLLTWTCLVAYKGHVYPVWDVRFSPHGYYFATASHDKTARLWATDHYQPLRIFAGHFSDVDKVLFHPNSNYVATGSSDRTVRLWDCISGNSVRVMTGHKAPIYALAFSVDGRFLASAGADMRVLMWDLAHGHLLSELCSHTATIHCLAFSRDGNILASGSLDCSVKLWDFTKLSEEVSLEDVNVSHNPDIRTNTDAYLLRSYATKNTPLLHLLFSRRNVLLSVGTYDAAN
ncbi:Transcription initiation factor TFIID [Nesidiocoris tenuis]|uniref:Transcription initiation factor TFIID n=1 Tax=Nesidiocoris tenuis TaxID=355587 RepID=A0ABN7AB27_9HEMI|nr:Transcription initiation factor TFIID [Nesidiocoris tenuis]